MRLYLAGPLMTLPERNFNRELKRELTRLGHDCFLPQEHEQGDDPRAIFESDRAGIDWCHAVVACMDGADPDSGTCWEVGYAHGIARIVVLYRTDFRLHAGPLGAYNLMMIQSADACIQTEVDEQIWYLAAKIDEALREQSTPHPIESAMPEREFFPSSNIGYSLREEYCEECHGPCMRRPRHGEANI